MFHAGAGRKRERVRYLGHALSQVGNVICRIIICSYQCIVHTLLGCCNAKWLYMILVLFLSWPHARIHTIPKSSYLAQVHVWWEQPRFGVSVKCFRRRRVSKFPLFLINFYFELCAVSHESWVFSALIIAMHLLSRRPSPHSEESRYNLPVAAAAGVAPTPSARSKHIECKQSKCIV